MQVARQVLTWLVKRVTLLFNSFCNVAKTICLIFCRIFNTILLRVKAIAIGKAEELVVVLWERKKEKERREVGVLGLKRVESWRNRRKLRNNAFKYLAIERGLKEGNQDKGEMEMREVGGFNLATFPLTPNSSGLKKKQQQKQRSLYPSVLGPWYWREVS